MRNRRSHIRADDGAIFSYLVLPPRWPKAPIPPGPDAHMLTVEGIPVCSDLGQALVTSRTNAFCTAMREEVVKGHIMRGVDPITGE